MDKKLPSPEYLHTVYVYGHSWLFMDPQRMLDIATDCLTRSKGDMVLWNKWKRFIKLLGIITPEDREDRRLKYLNDYKKIAPDGGGDI